MRIDTVVGELYVEDVGAPSRLRSDVILWHSFLHHGGMWRAQVDALVARGHRVINVDAPGHGRSANLTRPITMAECAAAVERILDARGVERASMVGLSWGGMVAFALAVARPSRLTSIAVFDTSCRREKAKNRLEYALLGRIFRRLGAVPLLMAKVEKLMFAEGTRARDRGPIDDWARYVARMDRDSVWHALSCIVDRPDLTEALARVRIPALVAVGEEDRAQPPIESEAIAAALPHARLVRIPGAAHLSSVERPREVNDLLLDFLSSREVASASV